LSAASLSSRSVGWLPDNFLKLVFAGLFLAPELFHPYGEADLFRWVTEIVYFFKFVSRLQENCSSAAFWQVSNMLFFLGWMSPRSRLD
jgi:hypothetical protein